MWMMSLAMFRVMALGLRRDRAALVMTFLLPPLVFLIFASVFSGTTGEDVKLKVAVADDANTAASVRLVQAMLKSPDLRAYGVKGDSAAAVRRAVRTGKADAGLVVRADPATPGHPLLIISDPSRAVAAPLTQARVQQVMGKQLPDVMLKRTLDVTESAFGGLTDEQKVNAADSEALVAEDARAGRETPDANMFDREDIQGARKGGGTIAYYAGAVSILFAMFSAMQGALSIMDERRSGISDRLLAGTAGMAPVVIGKFLFLVAQGIAQAAAIFLTADLVYGTPVFAHFAPWLVTTALASTCAAGLSLGIVSLCKTREQAQMLSTFVILILAAVGGSMVPRFLMPPWLQKVGLFTPHAWVIEAYQSVLWRDAGIGSVYQAWSVLAAAGLAGLGLAWLSVRYIRR
jgi:ABC-2 type transport system permease protein